MSYSEMVTPLVDRLRGHYNVGPALPNGEPEFGQRTFPTVPIQLEAADEIERLRAALAKAEQDIEDRDRAIESLRLKVDTAHRQIDALTARRERLAAECRAWRAFDAVNCCDWDITAEMRKTYPETTKARAAVDAHGDLEATP